MKLSQIELKSLLPTKIIDRNIHEDLFLHITTYPEVTVLYGPRQVGKSTEILLTAKLILEKNKDIEIFYYNLDYSSGDFENPEYFINVINASRTKETNKCYIYIDEAQRLENIGVFVKYIYDKKLNYKFVLTGSASLDIKEKIKEPLTGRKKEFYLNTLCLDEIIRYKGIDTKKISGYFSELGQILDEYLIWGGYPAIITEPINERKKERLLEISESYLARDLAYLFKIDDIGLIRSISTYFADNIGNLFSENGTSKALTISRSNIKKITYALEKTFILKLFTTYAKNKTKELTHSQKMFYYDCGLRNAVLEKLDPILLATDKGKLFENAVAIQLISKYGQNKVHYWRTQNQTEVDFIVNKNINDVEAYEVKYTYERDSLPKNLQSFTDNYKDIVTKAAVITKDNYWKYLL